MTELPTFEDVAEAAARINPHIHKTRVVGSGMLNRYLGAEMMFLCENQQRAGSFKTRGALNAVIARLDRGEISSEHGILSYSAGNHAQALALAASQLRIPLTVLMPTDAAHVKVEMTKSYGVTVEYYDPETDDREEIAEAMAAERNLTIIPPFNDREIIAGQGTAVRELLMEVGRVDAIVLPVGGGGLIGGSSLVSKVFSPEAQIWGVEPEGGDDARQSLEKGEIVTIDNPDTVCDGVRTRRIGDLTFGLMQKNVTGITTVPDSDVFTCMKLVADRLKLIAEPTGVLGMAGAMRLIADGTLPRGSRIGVVLSGGNVDMDTFAACITQADDAVEQMQRYGR